MMPYGLGNAMMGGSARDGAPQGLGGGMMMPRQNAGDPLAADKILQSLQVGNAGRVSPLQQMIARMGQPQQQPQRSGGGLGDIAKLAMMFI